MAEGLLRHLHADRFEAFSAGAHPAGVNPWAIRAMAELDIDISKQYSKSVDVFAGQQMDYVVTVCGASQACPIFSGEAARIDWEIEDPGARAGAELAEVMEPFRKTRDEIKRRIEETFGVGAGGDGGRK